MSVKAVFAAFLRKCRSLHQANSGTTSSRAVLCSPKGLKSGFISPSLGREADGFYE